jgi:hypothetical protein
MDISSDETLLDSERIADLTEEIGEEGLADVMLMFLDEVEAEISRISLGLDDDAHAKATHFVRSGSVNIGLKALADEASRSAEVPAPDRAASGRTMAGLLSRSRSMILRRWG